MVDDQTQQLGTLRLFDFNFGDRDPIPIDKVEPASEIVKRFSTSTNEFRLHLRRSP